MFLTDRVSMSLRRIRAFHMITCSSGFMDRDDRDRDVVSLAQWFLKSWSADRHWSAELKSPVRETIFEKKRSAYKK